MTGEERREGPSEITRRRFVQVCVGTAAVAAAGSTLASILGVTPSVEVPAPPMARNAVAMCPVCSVGCGLRSISSEGMRAKLAENSDGGPKWTSKPLSV